MPRFRMFGHCHIIQKPTIRFDATVEAENIDDAFELLEGQELRQKFPEDVNRDDVTELSFTVKRLF